VYTRILLESSRVLRRNGAYVDPIQFMYVTYEGFLAGEVCRDWQSWGVYLGIDSILGQSLLQSTAYILLSVRHFSRCAKCTVTSIRLQTAFATGATVLVISYAP
jgi:hypothetical protein